MGTLKVNGDISTTGNIKINLLNKTPQASYLATFVNDDSKQGFWYVPMADISVKYATSAGNANLLDSIDSTGFLRYYNGNNAGLTNADIVNTPSYLWTVSTTGGTINTSTRPSGMDNAWGVLHIHTHSGSYATQLEFGGTTGNLYFRNAYASDTFDNWKTLIHSGNISSQSVNYATSAGNADTVDGHHFHWSGQSGQPTWLWGGNEYGNMYVYNPSNFNVNYASTAGAVDWSNVTNKPSTFSPSSHTHYNIGYTDTRNDNMTPNNCPEGLSVHLKNNGTDGLTDGGTYHPIFIMKDWGDYSGGPYGQISITANNNLWFRASSSGTAWHSWRNVIHSGNYTSYCAPASHSHSYASLGSPNNLMHSGNEFTFAPDGYSGSVWFNYRTAGWSTNGNIGLYIFGNGKGSIAPIEHLYDITHNYGSGAPGSSTPGYGTVGAIYYKT